MTTTTGKRRRYPTGDSAAESDDENEETLNVQPQLISQRRMSATADLASHRLIVSERRQLAVLKQLTASDDRSVSPSSSSSIIPSQRPTKIFRRNEHGETIVHVAARKGDLKQLKKALKDGANVNEEDNAGWTPLHEAVTKNQYKAAHLLLKSGANANAPGPEGQTPLIDAVLNNNIKIVMLLLNYSADPSAVDLTRLNERMVKALKRELTTFDLSDNENDEESQSLSSLMNSADEFEHDEKTISESSCTSLTQVQQKQSFQYFREHSFDSSMNNKLSTGDNDLSRKNPYDFESDDDEHETTKQSSHSNDSLELKIDEQSTSDNEQTYRVPPLRIVFDRTVLSNMDENSMTESSSLPIIEQNEKFLSTIMTSRESHDKIVIQEEEQDKKSEENSSRLVEQTNSSLSNLYSNQSSSIEMIISTLMDNLLTQIELNQTLPPAKVSGEQQVVKTSETKQPTRTLRSHARGKLNSLLINSNNNRRVSNRRRMFEKKYSLDTNEKPPRKKTISERSNNNETSSNSDDQPIENNPEKLFKLKTSIIDRISVNEDINPGNGDDDSNSTKQVHLHPDIDSLPPNKRRLRERNTAILNSTDTTEENLPIEPTITRDIPINCIKQFLAIRQQIEKRHETMLNEFVLPKVPKDFAETLMAKQNYLLAPTSKSFSSTTPASLGIKRANPPSDLDLHLSDVFTRQEDERYRMKLRHQVEREKLILSHEQEVLRLYGNATRSSINQEIPFSYCLLLKDNEVYNNPSNQERPSTLINDEFGIAEGGGRRGKTRWNGRSFIKWLDDSNLKYKRLSCEINQRQHLEANTLYSMQRMVWLKHLPKETSTSSRMNSFLSEQYLSKVPINTNFWTHWQGSAI